MQRKQLGERRHHRRAADAAACEHNVRIPRTPIAHCNTTVRTVEATLGLQHARERRQEDARRVLGGPVGDARSERVGRRQRENVQRECARLEMIGDTGAAMGEQSSTNRIQSMAILQ